MRRSIVLGLTLRLVFLAVNRETTTASVTALTKELNTLMLLSLGRLRVGGNQPIYHPATSVKAISVVPSGGDKMDVHRENMDVRRENTVVRWVDFHPLVGSVLTG
jgi:hypothetical protein